MPTYEYSCMQCKRHVEAVQRFSDEPLRECPHCGGPLRRVFHPVGIVLKGSGFYSTDNRGSRKSGTAEPKKESAETSTETKKETKAAEPSSATSDAKTKPSGSKKDSKDS